MSEINGLIYDDSSNDKKTVIYAKEKYEEFTSSAMELANVLDDIPGAREAIIDYSSKLMKLIAKTTGPGIKGNLYYCKKEYNRESLGERQKVLNEMDNE